METLDSRRQVGGVVASSGDEREEDLSPMSEKGGNVFELFRTYDGEEYTVYVREDGKRFYVDWEEEVHSYHAYLPSVAPSVSID